MEITKARVWGQVYFFPYVKVTHTRELNGDLEIIVGWLKWQLIFGIQEYFYFIYKKCYGNFNFNRITICDNFLNSLEMG